jgi:hypothetical protein
MSDQREPEHGQVTVQCQYASVIPGSKEPYHCPSDAVWLIKDLDQNFLMCDPHAQDYLRGEPGAKAFPLYPKEPEDG